MILGSNGNTTEVSGGKGIFRPFAVLALPGVNLFRRFSTYRRLPQGEPAPKDRLEKELDRLTNKIVSDFTNSIDCPVSISIYSKHSVQISILRIVFDFSIY